MGPKHLKPFTVPLAEPVLGQPDAEIAEIIVTPRGGLKLTVHLGAGSGYDFVREGRIQHIDRWFSVLEHDALLDYVNGQRPEESPASSGDFRSADLAYWWGKYGLIEVLWAPEQAQEVVDA